MEDSIEDSIEGSKKRGRKYILKIYFSVFRASLISLCRINKVEEDKAIRINPDLVYLEIIKGGRYNVENWTIIYMGVIYTFIKIAIIYF